MGASEGLGASFARALATRRMNLLLLARRAEVLAQVAMQIREEHGVEVRCLATDVSDANFVASLIECTRDLEVGVLVYNAAFAPVGSFLDRSVEDLRRVADVNVLGPMLAIRALAPPMCRRERGAVVLMSSLSGFQGAPRIAAYAASKAFNTILAEGLWGELRERGIDVLASCAGAIRTPGYTVAARREAPGTLDPDDVARRTLDGLQHGPRVVPGWLNRVVSVLTGRLLPRRTAIRLIAANTKDLS